MTEVPDTHPSALRRLAPAISLAALVAAGVTAAVLYGTNRTGGKQAAAMGIAAGRCSGAVARVAKLRPRARGEMAAFETEGTPQPAPELHFTSADGVPQTLDSVRGRTVLVNFWATWCVPCRKEMPSLDRLQADLGGKSFEVVALDTDTARLDRAKAYYGEAGIKSLAYRLADADTLSAMKRAGIMEGLPTTVLIDGAGCQLGKLAGPAEWASPDAKTLIKSAIE